MIQITTVERGAQWEKEHPDPSCLATAEDAVAVTLDLLESVGKAL